MSGDKRGAQDPLSEEDDDRWDEAFATMSDEIDAPSEELHSSDLDDAYVSDEIVAPPVAHSTMKPRRLRGKQTVAEELAREFARRASAAQHGSDVDISQSAAPPDVPALLMRRPVSKQTRCHYCTNPACQYSTLLPNAKNLVQKIGSLCFWCDPVLLDQRLAKSVWKIRSPLQFFWENAKDVFHAAVAKLAGKGHPTLHLVLLVSPMFNNAESIANALQGRQRSAIVKCLRKTFAADEELYKLALAAFPEEQCELVDAKVRAESQNTRRTKVKSDREPGIANKSAWQETLKNRRRALASASEDELQAHEEHVAKDIEHARRRFFPVRASTWKRYRDVELPNELEVDNIPIEGAMT